MQHGVMEYSRSTDDQRLTRDHDGQVLIVVGTSLTQSEASDHQKA